MIGETVGRISGTSRLSYLNMTEFSDGGSYQLSSGANGHRWIFRPSSRFPLNRAQGEHQRSPLNMTTDDRAVRNPPKLDLSTPRNFIEPCKKIHEGQDVSTFLVSKAYTDIMTFLLQLNRSMFPMKQPDGTAQTWPLGTDAVQFSAPVRQLQRLLSKLEDIIQEVPPDTGPRRFGNISFRRWHEVLESRASDLLRECLPAELLQTPSLDPDGPTAESELKAYFLGSWGSGQRLDYGTGHELSFLAFLAAIWKLHGFPTSEAGVEERAIVLGVIEPSATPRLRLESTL